MAGTFQILLNGQPVEDDFYTKVTTLEVEENLDLPGAFLMKLPVTTDGSGDLTMVNDARLQPFSTVAIVAKQENNPDECIFDGLVLSHKLHLETGAVSSTVDVWGQDASWLMNLEEKTKEWADVTDGNVANSIFSDYGITPAGENTDEDSASHTETGHTLMQRGTDIQFLRQLARRNGKICRVACTDTPGQRTGYFARPAVDGDPAVTITLNPSTDATISALDVEWDVTRPSAVKARQALFNDSSEDGASGDTSDSGLAALDERKLADFAGKPNTVMLTAPVDDAGELTMRAQSLLIEAGWFAKCEGEADASRIKAVLRVGTVIQLDGAGSVSSGKYLVWSVRHSFTQDAHKMKFVMVRNAVGPAPTGGGGGGLPGGLP
jgi:phage protein D